MPLGTRLFTAVPFPKEATMSDRRTENDYESDDLLMNDDFELEDGFQVRWRFVFATFQLADFQC